MLGATLQHPSGAPKAVLPRVVGAADAESRTDSEVVKSFLEGDERAFDVIVGRYAGKLRNFVARTVGDRAKAEDLVQETFIRVFRHLHRFDQSRKFSTWIYTIAGNLAKNELRRRSRSPIVLFQTLARNRERDGRPLEWEDPKARPDDLDRKRRASETVHEAVDLLPEHHRVVFVLRELKGLRYDEIAEATGQPVGTVKSRLSRARCSFARIVAPMVD